MFAELPIFLLLSVFLQAKGFYGHELLAVSVFCEPNPILVTFITVEALEDFVLIKLVFEPLCLKKFGKGIFACLLIDKVETTTLVILLLYGQRIENRLFIFIC